MSDPLTILVTASGAPGSPRLLRALREADGRPVRLVGVDMRDESAGRFLCDRFRRVPPGSHPGYLKALLEVAEQERVDVVFPQSSAEVGAIAAGAERFSVPVLVSRPDAIERASAKSETVRLAVRLGIPQPRTIAAADATGFRAAAAELGYPGRDVCMKPVFSSGSRGFRVRSASADRHEQLLTNRPGVAETLRLEDLEELLGDDPTELLVMELATGKERTIDGIAVDGHIALGHPKTREAMRAGLAMYFETLDDPGLMETARKIVGELGLDHFFNIQLVGEHVIEINPRISTIVYQEDLNLPWLGIKHALGEITAEELGELASRIRPTRRALRYFDQVEWDSE